MGEIKVTVQTEKRLAAINNLSAAVLKVAEALSIGTTVEIKNCHLENNDIGIDIKTEDKVTETKIEKI